MPTNKEYQARKLLRRKYPWIAHYDYMKIRCSDKTSRHYKKGIKSFMTLYDVQNLWFRDMAWVLKKPCLDRIDNDGHYTFENCHFIEFSENSSKDNKKYFPDETIYEQKYTSLNGKRKKEFCKYGHKLNDDNIILRGKTIICRICHRARARKYALNKRTRYNSALLEEIRKGLGK